MSGRGAGLPRLRVLVTGGAGYVGSHVLIEALAAGHAVHVVDDLSTGRAATLERVRAIAGRGFGFTRADVADAAAAAAIAAFRPEAAIHLAGRKAVGESVGDPLGYYAANLGGALALISALDAACCRRLVFSSSAAVYGPPDVLPIPEDHPLRPESPYGRSKAMIERALEDLAAADGRWSIAMLRYFNPAGAHASGRIGEDPAAPPGNLMPLLVAAAARGGALTVHGCDWPTPDGTGLRDYLHVADLARAHVAALDWTAGATGADAFNLGTGSGATVLEVVAAFAAATGRGVGYRLGPRRPGDVGASYADASKAARVLGWRAERDLADICASAWAFATRDAATGRGISATVRTSAAAD